MYRNDADVDLDTARERIADAIKAISNIVVNRCSVECTCNSYLLENRLLCNV